LHPGLRSGPVDFGRATASRRRNTKPIEPQAVRRGITDFHLAVFCWGRQYEEVYPVVVAIGRKTLAALDAMNPIRPSEESNGNLAFSDECGGIDSWRRPSGYRQYQCNSEICSWIASGKECESDGIAGGGKLKCHCVTSASGLRTTFVICAGKPAVVNARKAAASGTNNRCHRFTICPFELKLQSPSP
jgi:hypothetical protein